MKRGNKNEGNNKKRFKKERSEGVFDNRRDFGEDIHEGSFPLEEVKEMEAYKRRIEQPPSSKRKFALAIGYCGTNYHGLQVNPGAVTIESILERALFLCGGIKEHNYGHLQKISWTRAARTDRGVHAVAQCCSMKLEFPEAQSSEFIDQINSFLPNDIQVLGITRTTKSFNARTHCSHRRYEYLLPSYMLMPEGEYNQIINPLLSSSSSSSSSNSDSGYNQLTKYQTTNEQIERLKYSMKIYEGTHLYHNFTSEKVKPSEEKKNDNTMMRYMMSIDVTRCEFDSVNNNESKNPNNQTTTTTISNSDNNNNDNNVSHKIDHPREWIKITILGQSFLLNQV